MDKELREKVATAIYDFLSTGNLLSDLRARSNQYAGAAIAAMPFNLLEHLKAGGKAENEQNEIIVMKSDCIIFENKYHSIVTTPALHKFTWKPYTEPELEDGWYWCNIDTNPLGRIYYRYSNMWYIDIDSNSPLREVRVMRHDDGTPMKIDEPKD